METTSMNAATEGRGGWHLRRSALALTEMTNNVREDRDVPAGHRRQLEDEPQAGA